MLELKPISRAGGLNRHSFTAEYLNNRVPVVFTDFMDQWPAKNKWTIDFFKDTYGHLQVPLFSKDVSKAGKNYMEPAKVVPLREYLELLEAGPTDLRMFLYNIFRHAPELCSDFNNPDIVTGWINSFPYMFFGGQGSNVPLHFDIDLSHVFLNQLHGRKRVVLFSPEQSKKIYHHPFTVASYINVDEPDYERYPALKETWGYETILKPGESLFIPSGFWHYIEYLDGGYSISLRANESYARRAKGLWNIAKHYVVDKGMNKIMGEDWRKMKANMAAKRAEDHSYIQ